jgi:rhamnose utilization protein RhaD (predicted bifunctional aldolase and dehydrogenase)
MPAMSDPLAALLQLSHDLGREDRPFAILGEGNTSARVSTGRFAVKASGCSLGTLTAGDLTVCDQEKLLALFDGENLDEAAMEAALLDARLDPAAKRPSIEALFHAWLLTLDGVSFVGHVHPIACNQWLCSPRAEELAEGRVFPDEVVCCGPASVFVRYADPGLPLALAIREKTLAFIEERRIVPRLILLASHGVIALGGAPQAVLAAMLMAEKAATIRLGAAVLGGPDFLSTAQIASLAGRRDEAYRQQQLRL